MLGTAKLDVDQSMTLSATASTWNELVTVIMTSGSPAVTSLNVAFDAGCDSACSMSNAYPWIGARTLTVGSSAQGTVTYTESLAYEARDYLTTQYHMYVTQSGTIPTQPNVNWSNLRKVRCDNAVYQQGSGSPGCVYADIQPNLEYSIAQYGAAAATYSWALNNLPNMAHTFMRMKGDSQPNRDRTCGYLSSVPFVPFDDSIVQDDSCDEFPFAGTYEGGTDGGLCAEIVPQYEGGVWNFYQADDSRPVTGDEPCVRSHVPPR